MLLLVLTAELVVPCCSFALTTGPTQPEVLSFEPVGTTDMVDMFSGDFNYNIPLLDVEGYPVNIAYHGGINMEQEASWVGLGWNINPGEINRNVRGVPDDFDGDVLSKQLHIKKETNTKLGLGYGAEAFGKGDPKKKDTGFFHVSLSADINAYINFNNYRGVSCDLILGGGLRVGKFASAGVNIGVGSQTGADIDYNADLHYQSSKILGSDFSCGGGIGVSNGWSSRSGLKDMNVAFHMTGTYGSQERNEAKYKHEDRKHRSNFSSVTFSNTHTIPIGLKNYVPVITNSTTMNSFFGRVKIGWEAKWLLPYVNGSYMQSTLKFGEDGSRSAYGYLYLQDAPHISGANTVPDCPSILDFTRDKDGNFNRSMQYLPPANMTYDIYTASGHGTGGMFRAFRNDYGSVYDPTNSSEATSHSLGLEAGLGDILEIGGDYTYAQTQIDSKPWTDYLRKFHKRTSGSVYEEVYLKSGGELTTVDPKYVDEIGGESAITPDQANGLKSIRVNSNKRRSTRANLIYYFTAEEASVSGIGTDPNIFSYTSLDGFASGPEPAKDTIRRIGSNPLERKKRQLSEIIQLQRDGKRFVYGIPALNHVEKEVTFSVTGPTSATSPDGLIAYGPADDGVTNTKGIDQYFSSTITPSYAHSYLLTSVLSTDYVDVTGNGISDDDLGSYTKLNYTLKQNDYRWRFPFESGKAQYNPCFRSDAKDDKASYVTGSREEWMLHSIETRNFIAEFYTSERDDACGSKDPIVTTGAYNIAPYNTATAPAPSYKLDSIKLFNKHDRFINGASAIPIKTVYFKFDYSLCKGIPNSISGSSSAGKLTLTKIYFSYGTSQKSMMSPYQFKYGFNPNYNTGEKDRWGGYKPTTPDGNFEFPFVNQNDIYNDQYAEAWSLTGISLPSGGMIIANYEADDYAFVQDQQADEMFIINGVGRSPVFNPSMRLYEDKYSPNLFVYFTRRPSSEKGLDPRSNYCAGMDLLYYNFFVDLVWGKMKFEQIKGYAKIVAVGYCPGDSLHGYVQLKDVDPVGARTFHLNPVTYLAINNGRYNLPQVMYPGSDPDISIDGAIAAMFSSFAELVNLFRNPIVHFLNKKAAQIVIPQRSYIRLTSPGGHKKGGGHRIKSLLFYDAWNTLSGGSEQSATYGKNYNYVNDEGVSSGVASYEPAIGNDENPLRMPVAYQGASGRQWPPMDPVDLYQETPIGESFYPAPSVGYSKITVSSIHNDIGKSAQGEDVYRYYTARDFPIRFLHTAINSVNDYRFSLLGQKNTMSATQGYSLIMNDMHGKLRSTEHYLRKPITNDRTLISSQTYNYLRSGPNDLGNDVSCLVYNPEQGEMELVKRRLGVEEDLTLDSREKHENTWTINLNLNLNVSEIGPLILPIFFAFPWASNAQNKFRSATVTKVVQKYGILDNVETYIDGATVKQKNEVYDPETGQVIITSVNNEYHDKEYSVNIPAYWCYSGMAPAYSNIKYETNIDNIDIDTTHLGAFVLDDNLRTGDEILLEFKDGTKTVVWLMSSKSITDPRNPKFNICTGYLLPRYPTSTPGWVDNTTLSNVHATVIRSGNRNMLNEVIESYSTLEFPITDVRGNPVDPSDVSSSSMTLATGTHSSEGSDEHSFLNHKLREVINIKANTFCDSNTRLLNTFLASIAKYNPYITGERGIFRPLGEYAFVVDRNYSGTTNRNAGLFTAITLFGEQPKNLCLKFPYNYMAPFFDAGSGWRLARTITKFSPFGAEVENMDALGNYSTVVFGYNDDLPVAVASNARQGEVMAEGFEDYSLLRMFATFTGFDYSFLKSYFSLTPLAGSTTYGLFSLANSTTPSVSSHTSHTGLYSLFIPTASSGASPNYDVDIPINTNSYSGIYTHYDDYLDPATYNFTSDNEYLPFKLTPGKKYLLSFWVKENNPSANVTDYSINSHCGIYVGATHYQLVKKSNIIEGWQQVEVVFDVPVSSTSVKMILPVQFYFDDMRFLPTDANLKSFVYHPVNEKLMATLDENNFAKMYEYDQEGNLVRVKSETEKGVMTVSESRSSNPKQ